MEGSLFLNNKIETPLSSIDISRRLNDRIRILSYRQLDNYKSIHELFEPFGAFVVLYETEDNFGHWVAVIKHQDKRKDGEDYIEHFDSYAYKPDEELKFVPPNMRNENDPTLVRMMYESGLPVRYSHNRFQKVKENGKDVNTCGRWVVLRIKLRDLDENEFYLLFKEIKRLTGLSYDQIAVNLTR